MQPIRPKLAVISSRLALLDLRFHYYHHLIPIKTFNFHRHRPLKAPVAVARVFTLIEWFLQVNYLNTYERQSTFTLQPAYPVAADWL